MTVSMASVDTHNLDPAKDTKIKVIKTKVTIPGAAATDIVRDMTKATVAALIVIAMNVEKNDAYFRRSANAAT